jgi:hypothetical protein
MLNIVTQMTGPSLSCNSKHGKHGKHGKHDKRGSFDK